MGQSKLTLQILHAYAAVGVQCSYLDCQNDTKLVKARLTGVSNEGIETTYSRKKRGCKGDYVPHVGHNNRDLLKFKLLLRPLSALTDEIEHNGERFVPIVKLAQKQYPDVDFSIQDGHCIGRLNAGVVLEFYIDDEIPFYKEFHNNIFGQFKSEDYDDIHLADIKPSEAIDFLHSLHFDTKNLLDSGDALPLTAPPSVTGDEG
jgi:hypothetical protein